MSDAKNIIEKAEVLEEELAQKQQELADMSSEVDILQVRIKEYEERIEDLTKQNEDYVQENAELEKASDELRAEVEKLTEEEAKVEVKVIEELQQLGVEPLSISATEIDRDYVAEFSSISDPIEKTKFYREHKDKILGGNN